MSNAKVSIIVPVYNVEKYLNKCVNSILKQTYNNIEIILVDDGSTDKSGGMCDVYKKKDDRVVVIHKKNGGLSDARNAGMRKSSGKLVTFIDSDDHIADDYIETLVKCAENNSADLVISRLKDYYENGSCKKDDANGEVLELTKEEAYKRMLGQDKIDVSATAKLYDRNILENIQFPVGEYYEDIQIIDKVIEKASKIVFVDYSGYYYLQRNNSIMYGAMSEKRLALIRKTEELVRFTSERYPRISKYAVKRHIYCQYHLLGRCINDKANIAISKKIRKGILSNRKAIFGRDIYTKKEKIATAILSLGLKPYKIFWNIYCKTIKNKGVR